MTEKKIGNGPIDHESPAIMVRVARALDALFNGDVAFGDHTLGDHKTGFILLAFPVGHGGQYNVVSNGIDNNGILAVFKEVIAQIEDSMGQGA